MLAVKSYTRKELIHLYGISSKTFAKWIDGLGLEFKRVFTPKEVESIFDKLGEP
jgi:hypothetical protein